jgi:hypothetical protein
MQGMSGGSRWLFQIALADRQYISGEATARLAMDLFDNLLPHIFDDFSTGGIP